MKAAQVNKTGGNMAKVSVLILAKNEEKNIGDCIESVKSFADEIIVIDDFSTDATAEISKNLGAKIFQRALNGDWASQRNFSIQQATCDWIFIIDSDERATPELGEEIKKILAVDDKKIAWRTARLNYFYGQPIWHGGWFPGYVTRLLPREGTTVEGAVHEKIVHQCTEKNIDSAKYLIHYPYRDWTHQLSKLNTYTDLMAARLREEGKTASVFDIIFRPLWAGFRMYILRGGFLDGVMGLCLSGYHAFYTLVKYIKLYYIDKNNL